MIVILGAGKMGESLLSGLLRAGHEPSSLVAIERHEGRAAQVSAAHGVSVVADAEVVKQAATLVVAVKPQDMASALTEISPFMSGEQLVISIAAGITTSFIEQRLPSGVPVVRVMPNTPALVSEAMSVISPGTHASDKHLARTRELFLSVGKVAVVP